LISQNSFLVSGEEYLVLRFTLHEPRFTGSSSYCLFQISQVFPFLESQAIRLVRETGNAQSPEPEHLQSIIAKLMSADFSALSPAACPFQIVAEFITALLLLFLVAKILPLADRLQIR
jgi:hypothetical protein